MTKTPGFYFLIILAFCFSCVPERVYELNRDFSEKFWHKDSVRNFQFHIANPDLRYTIYFNIRNTSKYPYQNIYVEYELMDSLNRSFEKQLLDLALFHTQTGRPFGSSGIGDIFDHQFPVIEKYEFPAKGNFTVRFSQKMRLDSLPEIISVGARVEISEEKN